MSSLRWILGFGRSGRPRLALSAALGALASGAAIGLAGTAAWLISRASQHPPVLYLMVAIVAVRAFGLARGFLRYSERLTGHDASFRILGDLRVATIEHLEQVLPIRAAHAEAMSSGDLLARFVDDVDGLQDLWVRVLLPYASAVLVGAATVALVVVLAPAAGIALALTLVVAAAVAPFISARAARAASTRLAPLRAEYQTDVLDLLAGATELGVYGALPARLERLAELDAQMTHAEARSAAAAGLGAAVATLAAGAAMWAGLWFGVGAVDGRTLAGVSLAVVVLVPLAVHEVLAGLAPAAQHLPALAVAASRVREVFEQPAAVREPTQPVPAPLGPYGLRLRNVRAAWTPGSADVLAGVDLDVRPGSRMLVVGPSGAGKSTLAAVLLRLLDPTSGTVELVGAGAGVDITRMAADDVRRIIGWCAQDADIFDSTIEANLRLAKPDATRGELSDALRRARLEEWIDTLPLGIATMVGEHGSRLSGGQRQRLALARVLLADRPIIVFDEPTEHLDEQTAVALAADLVAVTDNRTIIIVTHRPDLFPTVDTVATMRDGHLSVQADVGRRAVEPMAAFELAGQ